MAEASPTQANDLTLASALDRHPILLDERRTSNRMERRCSAKLIGCGCSDVLQCSVRDLSEGGVYLQVPTSYRVTVGQRYEVMLASDASAPDISVAPEQGWYATVVRTEPVMCDTSSFIGAGMRFDQPIFL